MALPLWDVKDAQSMLQRSPRGSLCGVISCKVLSRLLGEDVKLRQKWRKSRFILLGLSSQRGSERQQEIPVDVAQ